MKYSIVFLIDQESDQFYAFLNMLAGLFESRKESFELVLVENGSQYLIDGQVSKFELDLDKVPVHVLSLNRKASEALCFKAILGECKGKIIVSCGAYQQLSKESFAALIDALSDQIDIVVPWRRDRIDPAINQFQSRLFNTVVRRITGVMLNDLSCTVKVFRREVMENIELYGNMFRFLPIIAAGRGYKVKEIECRHYQERGNEGIYGLNLYIGRLIDICTLYFNTHYSRKPSRFFSSIGSVGMLLGMVMLLYIFAEKTIWGASVGDRPLLLMSLFFMVMGAQTASVGLLGEIIAFAFGRHKKEYTIEKIID